MRRILPICAVVLCLCIGCQAISDRPTPDGDGAPVTNPEGKHIEAQAVADTQPAAERQARERLDAKLSAYTTRVMTAFLDADTERPAPNDPLCRELTRTLTAESTAALLLTLAPHTVKTDDDDAVTITYRCELTQVNAALTAALPRCLDQINPFGAQARNVPGQLTRFLDARTRGGMTSAVRLRPPLVDAPPEQRVPSWLRSGRHARYPETRYLTAIGLDTDLDKADSVGAEELVATALARLRAVRRQTKQTDWPLAANLAALGAAPTITLADVPNWRVGDRWFDRVTRTHYVFVVLERTAAVAECMSTLKAESTRAVSLTASAVNHGKADNFAASLKDHMAATARARAAVLAQCRALALAHPRRLPEIKRALTLPILSQCRSNAADTLSAIALKTVSGDNQWISAAGRAQEPFVVRAEARGGPLPGIPVKLSLGDAVLSRAVTDAQGQASFDVTAPLPRKSAEHTLTAELDLATLAGQAPAVPVRSPSSTFHCIVRSPENTWFALLIPEKTEIGIGGATIAPRLRRDLTDQGYNVLPEADVLKHLRALGVDERMTDEDIRKAFADLERKVRAKGFLVLIVGRARTELVQTLQTNAGPLYVAHCPFAVSMLDGAPDGEAAVHLTGTGRAAWTGNPVEASRRALADAAERVAEKLAAALTLRFGAAMPRP
jgi:hypothetical protein